MLPTTGYAVKNARSKLEPFRFERRELGPNDVLIQILFCGICHSDIHQARGEWGNSTFPMVPGHEIVGKITRVGANVKKFKEGDLAGVGCFVDSCRNCETCHAGEEQLCEKGCSFTYNGVEQDKKTPTYGGYSSQIVVNENYALKVSPKLDLAGVAPLLCAGITTYMPLKRYHTGPGKKVGVVGLGGLGHMAVKLAASMGAEVTVFSTSPSKKEDAIRLGAKHFVVTKNENELSAVSQFDLIIDAVSAPHDVNIFLKLLRVGGALVLVGLPTEPLEISPFMLVMGRKILTGSPIGGIAETQEMLDYCADNNIVSDIEIIPIDKVNEAYTRTVKGDVRYRFVIDMASL